MLIFVFRTTVVYTKKDAVEQKSEYYQQSKENPLYYDVPIHKLINHITAVVISFYVERICGKTQTTHCDGIFRWQTFRKQKEHHGCYKKERASV